MFSSRKSAAPSAGGYNLTKSIRFRSSASAYLNRTPATTTNRKTWTWSGWVKRGTLGGNQNLFTCYFANNDTSYLAIGFTSDNINIGLFNTSILYTSAVYRDPSAWYHIVFALDTTQATDSNRAKLYVNGVQVTAFAPSSTYPAQNTDLAVNYAAAHYISTYDGTNYKFDGYMAEVNFIDGQALTPSSFGSTNAATGVWQPIKYTGTYGTNGFYLPFTDVATTSGSNAGLGKDFSGNSNYWTTNNISVTSGSTYDSMKDVPTLTDTDTANYCVINPVNSVGTALSITAANLDFGTGSSAYGLNVCSMSIRDKTYFEITLGSSSTGSGKNSYCGVGSSGSANSYSSAGYFGDAANAWSLGYSNTTAYINNNGTQNTQSGTIANGDVFMYAVDPANGKIWFGRNGTWYAGSPSAGTGASYTNLPTEVFPVIQAYNSSTHSINFGQRPFSYTPPTGFKALNTFNLPTPTIGATASTQANKYMNIVLYTGDNSSSPRSITGFGFSPDFVWVKARSNTIDHNLWNSVMGAGSSQGLHSNTTAAAGDSGNFAIYGYVSSLDSDGFTVTKGSDATYGNFWHNYTSTTYVAWAWDANGSGSTNTAGSITSTVSVNTTAGFSIVTYTGTGSNATVGHGLGVAPKWVIVKGRNVGSTNWFIYTDTQGATKYLDFSNGTGGTDTSAWNSTAPTSTVFSVGTSYYTNYSATTYVAYCFAQVAGYSAFGSYTGNGSSDGVFIYTGFRPKYVLVKRTSNTEAWTVRDSARNPTNVATLELQLNSSAAEGAAGGLDLLSNGFKCRAANAEINANADTYIYMAFAESPFKYANAR